MEVAVERNDSAYRFSATYFNRSLGYVLNQINGTASDDECVWVVKIEKTDGKLEEVTSKGISKTRVRSGQSLVISYEVSD